MSQKENSKSEKLKKFLLKNAFPLFGLGALIWFLIRVIPKPTRAAYPCMQVAAPMASTFVLWLLGLSVTIFSFKKFKGAFSRSSFGYMALFLVVGIGSLIFTLNQSSTVSYGARAVGFEETVTPNYPIGVPRGIQPGAVVWVWNPDATNENCTNTYYGSTGTPADENDDGWFLTKNNNQVVIDSMLSDGLMELSGDSTEYDAWESIFTYFNNMKYDRSEGYSEGEKIFIKINATSNWGKGQPWGNITDNFEHMRNDWYGMAETSPHLILSLLRQLVNVYGVPQSNISIGDPMKHIYKNSYDIWYNEFPEITYVGYEAGDGRVAVIPTDSEVMIYSDKGSDMDGAISDKIYTVMNDADYLINVPTMKAHARGGVTLFAKNHFGSHSRSGAEHLHPGLVAINNAQPVRTDSGMYRVQVDNMGHEKYGQIQVLFLLDALWSGSEAVDPPTKWDLAPFNHDWTSSILLSQDNVAIESVAFDFLYAEYDGSFDKYYRQKVNYPHMDGTTDYLRQAASSDYWAEGVTYDPENDGTPITSLGVNEHWNNPEDKQYTRNLGTGEGINLIFVDQTIATDIDDDKQETLPVEFALKQNYPNPFNPSTTISFALNTASSVKLDIYDLTGSLITTLVSDTRSAGYHNVVWNGKNNKGQMVASGNYIYTIRVNDGVTNFMESKKMMLLK